MMHKFFVFCVLLLQSWFLIAQNDSLPSKDTAAVKVFLIAGVDYGTIYDHNAFTLDINGGFEYHNVYFGGFGCSVINDIEVNQDTLYQNMQMDLGYGGLILGYDFFAEKSIHFFAGSQFGWGVVSLSQKKIANKVEYMERIYYDNVFLVKPMAMIEFAITPHFTINAGGDYSFMNGLSSLKGFSNNDFKGINYVLSLKYHL